MSKKYTLSTIEDSLVLQVKNLRGEYENKQILRAVMSKIDGGFPNFVVDLTHIEFMNSVGLNFLIALKKQSKAAGSQLALANASKKIVQLLEITKLQSMFYLTNSVEEALQSFAACGK